MPTRASIVINDGAATPAAHTFVPSSDSDGVSLFEDKASGIAIGFNSIMVRVRRPIPATAGTASDAKNRVYRVNLNVVTPIMESTSASTGTGIPPAPTVAYTPRCNMEWLLPERSTTQNRKDLVAYVANLLANADIKKVLQDLEDFW